MEKIDLHNHVRPVLIHKNVYRPASSVGSFARFLMSILVAGQSPIHYRAVYDRRSKP
jgi:hypothetical protein